MILGCHNYLDITNKIIIYINLIGEDLQHILVDGHIGDHGDGLLIFSGDILIGVFAIVIIFKDTLHL